MNKIDCIEDYFSSIRAYYLFLVGKFFNISEYKDYILDKKYLNGSKVAVVSNLMLGIKEDLVNNKGNMDYQSKVFIKSLENSVEFIATKVENGYKLSNYVFPDAATLVAILRNKLAHGKYRIDFEYNRVIFQHNGVDIVINIEKLVSFVLLAFRNKLRDTRDTKYERNMLYYARVNQERTEKIKDLSEVRKIIKNYYYVSFTIESLNGMPVFEDCIQQLEGFIKRFHNDVFSAIKSDHYYELVEYLKRRNCKLNIEYKSLRDKKEIDRILEFASADILGNENLSYAEQIKVIGLEVQKSINGNYRNFNAITANVGNIMLLDAINKVKSVEDKDLSVYIGRLYPNGVRVGFDEFGMTMLAMFNSLFIYPFDDVYNTSGEYSVVREDVFDFSMLDLSMVNPTIVNIDDSPLITVKARLDSLNNKIIDIGNKISQQQSNLSKVIGKPDAVARINQHILDLNSSLSTLKLSYIVLDSEYNAIKNDFIVNHSYFLNKSIIEGIRNSIAHGHYEFVIKGDLWATEIIFNDIYEGKVTFQVRMTFNDFIQLIDNNYDSVLKYVKNKGNGIKK